MDKGWYLFIALIVFAAIVTTFTVSYMTYLRMPPPKGCDKFKAVNRNCDTCVSRGCEKFLDEYKKSKANGKKEAGEDKNN